MHVIPILLSIYSIFTQTLWYLARFFMTKNLLSIYCLCADNNTLIAFFYNVYMMEYIIQDLQSNQELFTGYTLKKWSLSSSWDFSSTLLFQEVFTSCSCHYYISSRSQCFWFTVSVSLYFLHSFFLLFLHLWYGTTDWIIHLLLLCHISWNFKMFPTLIKFCVQPLSK